MTIDFSDDIFSDFLIEAGEILENLSEQLVDLEQAPDDSELLNSIFRGYHTIKGGAGFLSIEAMVTLCHKAEDVFNRLRSAELVITPELMDAVFQATDSLGDMFSQLQDEEVPDPADPAILEALDQCLNNGSEAIVETNPDKKSEEVVQNIDGQEKAEQMDVDAEFDAMLFGADDVDQKPPPEKKAIVDSDLITDDEFEALLDELHGGEAPKAVDKNKSESGDITDDEFEALLDDLHGDGAPQAVQPEQTKELSADDGDITEDEFEALLDQLHGSNAPGNEEPKQAEAPKPAPVKKAAKPVAKPAVAKKKASAKKKTKKTKKTKESMIRVDTQRLDDIMNLVGELVLVRNRLSVLQDREGDDDMGRAVSNLDAVTSDLQTAVMKTRMQPVKRVFGRFPRVVRDLARSLKKEIDLELYGEDTDLDRNLVEALSDPLVHLVRNSVDHGIELPDEREATGKPRCGTVTLSAAQEGDHILLVIEDDGKGMNPDMLRGKAVEKGLLNDEEAATLTDGEAFNLIFHPGFSTKDEISDISGRGVGMDVVRTKLNQLGAAITIESKPGIGTRILIKVPLTLAIMPALMVILGKQRYALPLSMVQEILDLDRSKTNNIDHQEVLVVRNATLPIYYLRKWFVHAADVPDAPEIPQVVTIELEGGRVVGFVVDGLIGQEEIVIKPLGAYVHGVPGFAGASVGGDGKVALILDVPELMRAYA
ncbi:MAG: chemotaxis protein CheA [bacterium]